MTTAEHKIKNIITYLVPSAVTNIMPFITLPIITRFLTPKDFGIVVLATTSAGLILNILVCNIDTGAHRYYFEYRRNKEAVGKLINSSLVYFFGILIFSFPLIFLLRNLISRLVLGSAEYSLLIPMAYLGCFFSVLVNFYLLFYRNMERAKKFSFFTTLQMLINIAATLILVIIFRLSYAGIIYAMFLSSFIIFIFLFFHFIKEFPYRFDLKMLKDNFIYGVPLLPNLFSGSIQQFFDKYLLRAIQSLSSTGIFSIAQNISNRMFIFMTAVQSTFHPLFMKDMFDKGRDGLVSVGRNFTIFTYISLSAILPAILFGEEIVYILAPKSYYGIINVFIILLSGISTQTFGKIIGAQLAYAKKAYLTFPLSVFGLVANVLLNLLLIPKFGAEGAALTAVSIILLTNFINVIVAQRYYSVAYEKNILFCIYFNVFLSAIFMIYLRRIGSPLVVKYFVKTLSLAAFVITGMKANIITKRNIGIIFNFLKFKKAAVSCIEA